MIGKEVDFCIWLSITLAWKVSHAVRESWLQKVPLPSVPSRRYSRHSGDAGPGQLVPMGRGGGRCIQEHRHRPPGWLEGKLLSCVSHCPHSCLSPMSGAASWAAGAVSLGLCRLPHVGSTAACTVGLLWTSVCWQAHRAGELVSVRVHTCVLQELASTRLHPPGEPPTRLLPPVPCRSLPRFRRPPSCSPGRQEPFGPSPGGLSIAHFSVLCPVAPALVTRV